MKNVIAFIVSFIFISNLFSQSDFYKDSSLFSLRSKPHLLKNFNFNNYQNHNLIVPGTNHISNLKLPDPSVLKLSEPVLTYVGKSNHSEIYKSTPDNMHIIKPDSTFVYNMPVATAY